jgi:hypothetical protein
MDCPSPYDGGSGPAPVCHELRRPEGMECRDGPMRVLSAGFVATLHFPRAASRSAAVRNDRSSARRYVLTLRLRRLDGAPQPFGEFDDETENRKNKPTLSASSLGFMEVSGAPSPRAARGSHPVVTAVAKSKSTTAPPPLSRTAREGTIQNAETKPLNRGKSKIFYW